jgi:uncharacterized protein (TIGR03437 family)
LILGVAFGACAFAQRQPAPIPSLKTVTPPPPSGLAEFVRDQGALVILGKTLFWDLQTGSDGKVACASCHFHAGADHRRRNQIGKQAETLVANRDLTIDAFPFYKLSDPTNAASGLVRDSKQVTGSAGVPMRAFHGLLAGLSSDQGTDAADPVFKANGLNTRQVTGRNSPSVINAVFNFRNFWDGRARNSFSGQTPFGESDQRANVLVNRSGALTLEKLNMANASLASQAVGPVLNGVEMSYTGRNWPDVGKKLLALRPLAHQRIAVDDSVLGPLANAGGPGFAAKTSYLDLVKTAFEPRYWDSTAIVDASGVLVASASTIPPGQRYTQAEFNFAVFFGLAVQAYEATLISNDSPVDRFAEGDLNALSPAASAGLLLFTGGTGCSTCHAGAELTLASHSGRNGNSPLKSGAETGFFHIGIRPPAEDPGLGASDDFGKPLSGTFPVDGARPDSAQGRFKTPGLRNVELTGPYMHDGGEATLEQVVDFYLRGGNFAPNEQNGPNVRPLALTPGLRENLVAFMKELTDERVKFERAPFDHPELCVADGHTAVADPNPGFVLSAADRWVGLPAVGRGGNAVPLQTFEELLAGTGSDGSRAHHLAEPCRIDAVTARGFVNVNAASFASGVVARDSIVTAYGTEFADVAAGAATTPLPDSLAGRRMEVQDAAGVVRSAPLFYVSPRQINFAMPEGAMDGPAVLRVTGGSQAFRAEALVSSVAPGLFAVGPYAAANIVRARDGQQTVQLSFGVDAAGGAVPIPIDLGPPDQQTVLVLYGTGIRHHRDSVTARVGNETITAAYAGPQGTYAGEDQINVPLPRSLAGAGVVDVLLTVDGLITNVVKIQIR